jgi:hypothetical protein
MLTLKPRTDQELGTDARKTVVRTRRVGVAFAIIGIAAATTAITVHAIAQSSPPTLQSLIPKDAQMAGSIQANWLWDATASIRKTPEVSKAIAEAEAKSGLSFEDDIAPWAGQIGVAGVHVGEPNGQVLVYAEIRDSGKFMSTIAKLGQKWQNAPAPTPGSKNAGGPPTFATRDYQGVTVYDLTSKHPGPKDEPVSFAVINGWAIGAFGKGGIEHAIDVYQGRFPSLQSAPSWTPVFAHLPQNATAWGGFDLNSLMKAFGGPMPAMKGPAATSLQSNYAFAFTDEGNGLRFDVVTAPQSAKEQAMYVAIARNLKPVSGQILKKVPDGIVAGMFTNPAYWWTFMKGVMRDSASTPKERRQIAEGLKEAAPLDHTLPYFHGDAGFVVTWRKDRGFGLVLLAHADSHNAALHAASAVVNSVKQMGIPLQRGGNSWSVVMPGMMMPPNVPLKLAPFISAKDEWLVIGSNPSWTASTSPTPALQIPAYAVGSPMVGILSFRFLPAVFDLVEQQAPPDDPDVKQGIALARGLHLETSTWTTGGYDDPAGHYSRSTIEIANWDWRAALDNTVTAIQNWKPSPTEHKGHNLLKHGPDVSQSAQPTSGI